MFLFDFELFVAASLYYFHTAACCLFILFSKPILCFLLMVLVKASITITIAPFQVFQNHISAQNQKKQYKG